MRTPNSATNKDASGRQDVDLRDLTRSMIRFTNAVTLFSIQRMQSALGTVTDSQALIDRFCDALDAISNTLSTQIDASKKSTLDRMTGPALRWWTSPWTLKPTAWKAYNQLSGSQGSGHGNRGPYRRRLIGAFI